MFIYTYIYIYAYLYIYHKHIHICIYIYIYVSIYIYIHIFIYIYITYIHIHNYKQRACIHVSYPECMYCALFLDNRRSGDASTGWKGGGYVCSILAWSSWS